LGVFSGIEIVPAGAVWPGMAQALELCSLSGGCCSPDPDGLVYDPAYYNEHGAAGLKGTIERAKN